MITVLDSRDSSSFQSLVEVDDYLPLRFRTYSEPLGGVRYVRIGNGETRLLELILPSDSMEVRGCTVPLIDKRAYQLLTGPEQSSPGLPIIDLPNHEFSGPPSAQRVDTHIDFVAAIERDTIEFQFGGVDSFDRSVGCGDVCFLIRENDLVGIRVKNRLPSEMECFVAQLA